MISKEDDLRMSNLINENPEARYIIERLQEEHQFVVSQMSHEIRNPVTLINSSLQLIAKQHPEVEAYDFWKQTIDDVKYLRHLLDELSAFNNGTYLNISPVHIESWLNTIANSFLIYINSQNKHFSCNIESNLPVLNIDMIKLQQAISNLLHNAADAVEPGHEVQLSAFIKVNALHIVIQDDGCGITNEQMDSMYSPFVTYKKNGSGLGLPISRRIVASHNGTLTAQSIIGQGSTFTITLPIE